MEYTVAKNGRFWSILADGKPMESGRYVRTKRECLARIPVLIEKDNYAAMCAEQDKTGVYIWTPLEQSQIDEYASLLRANAPRWTFNGQFPLQDIGREMHKKDAAIILNPDIYFAEKRRTMAARKVAYALAGIEL